MLIADLWKEGELRAPHRIDLNADLGEGADDDKIVESISSANIACGFHAGGPTQMAAAVARCAARDVAIGAHPSYPDPAGFGRRYLDATADEIYRDVLYQIGALAAFCRAAGAKLCHVKPHGALYNHAAVDRGSADAIARAVHAYDPALALFAPPGSQLLAAATAIGLLPVAELFADRAVNADGSLVSRRLPNAMIHDPNAVCSRAVRMILEQRVTAIDGTQIAMTGDTICLHGDAPGAADRAGALRRALEAAGITVAPPSTSPRRGD